MDHPFRILVVDDEIDLVRMLQTHLEAEGYQVLTAANGTTALTLLSQDRFDLLLIDVKIPDMSGLDIVRVARQVDHNIAIIMMTAYATIETVVEALRLGADDFLVKPFRVNFGLLPMMERCLARRALGHAQPPTTEVI